MTKGGGIKNPNLSMTSFMNATLHNLKEVPMMQSFAKTNSYGTEANKMDFKEHHAKMSFLLDSILPAVL